MRLHIAIVSAWFPEPTNTSGIFVCEQADALIEAGNKVSVFMYRYFSPLGWLRKKLKGEPLSNWVSGKHSVPYAYNFVNFFPTRFSANPLIAQKKAFLRFAEKKLACYIKINGKPDIIHHHEVSDFCYITAHLSKKFNIPYILTEHSPFEPEKNHFNPYETQEERQEMIKNASVRIAVSKFYQKKYEQFFGAPFIVIPNLVDSNFFTAPLPDFPKPNTPFCFINVGSLSKVKQQGLLIKAFAEAFKNNANVRLVIVGKGDLENELKTLISSLDMEGKIMLLGYVKKEKLMKIEDKSHVLVVSSEKETFSVAAAEALARGNPVLTTRCGGPEDFVDEKNGLICNVNDEEDMKQKLMEIYTKYSLFNYKQIAEAAKEKFSQQTIVSTLMNAYGNALGIKN